MLVSIFSYLRFFVIFINEYFQVSIFMLYEIFLISLYCNFMGGFKVPNLSGLKSYTFGVPVPNGVTRRMSLVIGQASTGGPQGMEFR